MFAYLSGTSGLCQHGANSQFFGGFSSFGPMHQNFVPQGGVCVCFLKSVRKGRFRNVWVGGGVGGHSFEHRAEQEMTHRTGHCSRDHSGVPRGHMQVAVNRLYEAFLPGCQAHAPAPTDTPRASSFPHQRFLWCIGGGDSTLREFVGRHGACLLTKGGNRQHTHCQKRTKISRMLSAQHADLGCSK